MANSGGGAIIVGANDDGTPSGQDVSAVRTLDAADVANKVQRYTSEPFADVRVERDNRDGNEIAILVIGPADFPLAFTRPGTYPDPNDSVKQRNAFSVGTFYFRHGPKSEPGTTHDLRTWLQTRLDQVREEWLQGIRRVVTAPEGSRVEVLSPGEVVARGDDPSVAVCIVDDPSAPTVQLRALDETHPWRQKELVRELNRRFAGKKRVTTHDIQAIRRAHGVDDRPEFAYRLKYASARYSLQFADWIVAKYESDARFFQDARIEYRASQKLRRKKPR